MVLIRVCRRGTEAERKVHHIKEDDARRRDHQETEFTRVGFLDESADLFRYLYCFILGHGLYDRPKQFLLHAFACLRRAHALNSVEK